MFVVEDGFKHPSEEKKIKLRTNILGPSRKNSDWVIKITIISFLLSALLSTTSSLIKSLNIFYAVFIVLAIIILGILFDIIGIAVTAADEAPFHAMASRKFYGAKRAIKLIRNANKVSSFCNDVVGDICGVVSGTAGAIIVINIAENMNDTGGVIVNVIAMGTIAAFTIGGKAVGKTIAIHNSNYIVYRVGIILSFFDKKIKSGTGKNNAKER
jgi:hypothetical protein